MDSGHGFTLTELVLISVIIAILTALLMQLASWNVVLSEGHVARSTNPVYHVGDVNGSITMVPETRFDPLC